MSKSMKKFFTGISVFLITSTSFATVVVPRETSPDSKALASLGINVEFYKGLVCGASNDVYISVPKKYNDAKFSGSTLTLAVNGEIMLFVDLPKIDSVESVYSKKPFYGTTFCLHPSKYDSASVSLSYKKGKNITEVITLNNIGMFKK